MSLPSRAIPVLEKHLVEKRHSLFIPNTWLDYKCRLIRFINPGIAVGS